MKTIKKENNDNTKNTKPTKMKAMILLNKKTILEGLISLSENENLANNNKEINRELMNVKILIIIKIKF